MQERKLVTCSDLRGIEKYLICQTYLLLLFSVTMSQLIRGPRRDGSRFWFQVPKLIQEVLDSISLLVLVQRVIGLLESKLPDKKSVEMEGGAWRRLKNTVCPGLMDICSPDLP